MKIFICFETAIRRILVVGSRAPVFSRHSWRQSSVCTLIPWRVSRIVNSWSRLNVSLFISLWRNPRDIVFGEAVTRLVCKIMFTKLCEQKVVHFYGHVSHNWWVERWLEFQWTVILPLAILYWGTIHFGLHAWFGKCYSFCEAAWMGSEAMVQCLLVKFGQKVLRRKDPPVNNSQKRLPVD